MAPWLLQFWIQAGGGQARWAWFAMGREDSSGKLGFRAGAVTLLFLETSPPPSHGFANNLIKTAFQLLHETTGCRRIQPVSVYWNQMGINPNWLFSGRPLTCFELLPLSYLGDRLMSVGKELMWRQNLQQINICPTFCFPPHRP